MIKKLLAPILLLIIVAGCSSNEEPRYERQIFSMDTSMLLTAYGKDAESALDAVEQEIYRLNDLFGYTGEKSDVLKINNGSGGFVPVSEEIVEILNTAFEVSKNSDGAFDISIYPLVGAWGFVGGDYRVPSEGEIERLLPFVGYGGIEVSDGSVKIEEGMSIDLGGIAKGYASARVVDIMREIGVTSAVVSLGGNVQALGLKPDGSKWRVGIQDPRNPDDSSALAGILELSDMAAITSGGYQRNFEFNGKFYHHILDPSTGYPAESGLLSVTVVCEDGAKGDALSTALFVLGFDDAISYWREYGGFEAVFIMDDGLVISTEGLRDSFTKPDGDSGYEYEFIS